MNRFVELHRTHRSVSLSKRKPYGWLGIALACAGMVLFFATGLAAAHSQRQAISAEAFWQQIDQTIAWLKTNPPETSADWQAEAGRWEKFQVITLPDQQRVQVDTRHIVQLLRAKPPEPAKIRAYLTTLKETRSLTTEKGGEDKAKLLAGILARPEFQYETGELNILQRIYKWLLETFLRLIEFLFRNVDTGVSIPAEVTVTVSVLIIAAVLAFAFRDTLRNLFNETELAEETLGEGEFLSARSATQKAQELSSSGDYRHALRYLYLSALLLLEERGLLRYNRAQTNREYLRQVRSRPDLSEHLKVVVDTFDRVWYGFQPIDADAYAQYARHVTALEETKE